MSCRRLAVITSRFPYGVTEAFLGDEIAALSGMCELTLIPAVKDLAGLPVLLEALREFVAAPWKAARVFVEIVSAPRSLRAKLKNGAIFPRALALARLLRDLRIEHVHAYWLSAPATVAYVIWRMTGIPWSATGHRYDLVDYNLTSTAMPRAGIVREASFVRAISDMGGEAVRRALGSRDANVHMVRLGIRVPAGVVAPSQADVLRLLCAAALVPVKDHATLLRAIGRAKRCGVNIVCTLAGDGPERESLQRLAGELGVTSAVRFEGFVPHEELLSRMSEGAYDAAVMTSLDRGLELCEGVPVALVEAMAFGMPCVATASGSIPELVTDAENGILCEPGDEEGIAAAFVALARRPELRAKLGSAARRSIEQEFDVKSTARQMAELLGVAQREVVLT